MKKVQEADLSKWLRAEVAAAFAIGSFVAGVIIYFMNPVHELRTDLAVMQTQVTNIKNNDLVHIFESQTKTEALINSMQQQQIVNTTKLQQIIDILGK